MTREDLVRIIRAVCAGSHRTLPDGGTETKLPTVVDPGSFDPPEWVLEAMAVAYRNGHRDGQSAAAGLYPEGG